MNTVSKRIRARREELGYSQDELASKMGYKSRSSINKIESGVNDIPQSKIVEFAIALDTTPSYLMGWELFDKSTDISVVRETSSYLPVNIPKDFIQKMNLLDEKGRHTVSTVLEMEWQRCNKEKTLNAAHEIKNSSKADKIYDDLLMDDKENWD